MSEGERGRRECARRRARRRFVFLVGRCTHDVVAEADERGVADGGESVSLVAPLASHDDRRRLREAKHHERVDVRHETKQHGDALVGETWVRAARVERLARHKPARSRRQEHPPPRARSRRRTDQHQPRAHGRRARAPLLARASFRTRGKSDSESSSYRIIRSTVRARVSSPSPSRLRAPASSSSPSLTPSVVRHAAHLTAQRHPNAERNPPAFFSTWYSLASVPAA